MSNFRSDEQRGADARTLRLCKVALRVATSFLAELSSYPELEKCVLLDVLPGPASSGLTVMIGVSRCENERELEAITEVLAQQRGALRMQLAYAIHRKRVPMIQFAVVPMGASVSVWRGGE